MQYFGKHLINIMHTLFIKITHKFQFYMSPSQSHLIYLYMLLWSDIYLQLICLQMMQQQASFMKIVGNLESISVGAMVQIIKNEIAQGNRDYYQPFENEYYDERIELTPKNQNINSKIQTFFAKYSHLIKKKNLKIKEKNKEKKESKQDQTRKQSGTYNDGSLGAYGGKKYQGLGARDEFDTFRRQKSQNYYQSLQEKSK